MYYDSRNRKTIMELAPNTRVKAMDWYGFCLRTGANVLITDALRTIEEKRDYVARGVSKTMRSWHLVGQALDFVPVNEK